MIWVHGLKAYKNWVLRLQHPIFIFANMKFLDFLLAKKSIYRSVAKRNDSHDSDFFIYFFLYIIIFSGCITMNDARDSPYTVSSSDIVRGSTSKIP